MNISTVAPEDFADVLSLNEACVPHVSSIGRVDLAWFADTASYFRVAKEGSKLAGFLIGLRPGTPYQSMNYRWFCERYDDFAYIDRIAIAPWAQRRGLGHALYEEFATSQDGAPVLTCEVNVRPANEQSMRFHTGLKFAEVGRRETEDGQKEVAMLVKTL